jgi:hypothetical protein
MAGTCRDAVIYLSYCGDRQNEMVVKELCLASATASETFRFKNPYKITDHSSSKSSINYDDGQIEYGELHPAVNEAMTGFAPLYTYGVSKVTFL